MFHKYPFRGWLFLALCCWAAASIRYYQLSQLATPLAMTDKVSKDMQHRQEALNKFLSDEALVKRMFADSLSVSEADALSKKPFYIYALKADNELIFWNNNTVVGTCISGASDSSTAGLFRYNGTFYRQCLHPSYLQPDEYLVALFPLRYKYALQNDYLQSLFLAADYIPSSTNSSDEKKENGFPVLKADGTPLFYLYFHQEDLPYYIPDLLLLSLAIAALLASLLWLHLWAVSLSRRGKAISGLSIVVAAILVILSLAYTYGAPFHLNETILFSKNLFSSNILIPSLAVLLILLGCVFWLVLFIVSNISSPLKKTTSLLFNFILGSFGILILLSTTIFPIQLIQKIVLDSQLSFDVSNLNVLNSFTPIGLFTVVFIICCSSLILYCCNFHLQNFIPSVRHKYLYLLIGFTILYIWLQPTAACQFIFAASILLLLYIFDRFYLSKKVSILSSENFIVTIIIAIVATFLLFHFNDEKKQLDEKAFAENTVRQRDEMMEYLFNDIADSLQKDRFVKSYLDYPNKADRSYIEEHITTRYLRGQLNKYQATLYFFNQDGRSLYNADTLHKSELDTLFSQSDPIPFSPYLFYFENAKDNRYYIANIPIEASGNLVIALQLRQAVDAAVYPELLEPATLQKVNTKKNYTYGVYANRELITQNNDYPFPFYLRYDTMKAGTMRVLNREGYTINIYKVDDGKQVAVIDVKDAWIEVLTLFSYIIGLMMLGILLHFLFSLYFRQLFKEKTEKLIRLTLRSRIHLAMLSTVMLAFMVLGVVTIFIFKNRYENTNKNRLRYAMQQVERALQSYLENNQQALNEIAFNEATQTIKFKNYISNLAVSKHLDVNIYNSYGTLNATSQEDIYNKALLARIMMPEAYFNLTQLHSTLLLQDEHIGKLRYLSSYAPVRNKQGNAIGYINVPFFSSQRELNYQISNILVALINIYVMVFLLSGILAVSITNRLTKGFQLLIEKFRTFNLKENEKIAWDYDDEIGLLLKEYNKMVEKVITNAKRLAQSERESAWREMAQQVAHEIKNPLTPMKLNVQYLQQAIDKKQIDIEQLTKKVALSLVEQIDNLTNIASAFSDFAKMPPATPEIIPINQLLHNNFALYKHSNHASLQLHLTEEPILVYLDKDQLLRVLNNLIKNAFESIDHEVTPQVSLSLKLEDAAALITIQDNGVGISEAVQQKIFSPYFTTKSSGTGLGLAMTKKIVEFWNGRIWFETSSTTGTRFFITLPIYKSPSS